MLAKNYSDRVAFLDCGRLAGIGMIAELINSV
jgi:hypothetical protein